MSEPIKDGTGKGSLAEVYSDNKLSVRSVQVTENQDAVVDHRAWNVNTGWMTGINSNSALIYIKNAEDEDFFVDSIAVGLSDGSATDVQSIYFVVAPTGGTIVDDAELCDMTINRRVGSGATFSSETKAYKATGTGKTLTGGYDAALFAQNDQGRLFATVDFLVPKGNSVGIRMETAGSFSGSVYAAIIGHQRKAL